MPALTITDRIKALQRRLGLDDDGVLGAISLTRLEDTLDACAKAMGRSPAAPSPAPRAEGAPVAHNLEVSTRGLEDLVAFEITSEARYRRALQKPVWPGGESGATIGIGYDLGFNTAAQIRKDWGGRLPDADVEALVRGAGKKGPAGKAALRDVGPVDVPYDAAKRVFYTCTLPRFAQLTRQAYPGVEKLPPDAQAALLSLVYNRGASLAGPRRTEMAAICECVKRRDLDGIAAQLTAMKRLWSKSELPGLHDRRDREAKLVAGADRRYADDELVRL